MAIKTSSALSIKKQYGAVDFMRMIMAICVLFIHRGYVMDNESAHFIIRNAVCEFAVPFFVCTTSFFIYRKNICAEISDRDNTFKKYLAHISLLFVLWTVIYFPVACYKSCFAGGETLAEFVKNYIYTFLVGGETFLHLWYIQALIISSLLIYLLQKKIPTKILLAVFWILYVVYAFGMNSEMQAVSDVYNKIPPAIVNYICRISVYILIGKLIAENQNFENNLKKNGIGLTVSLIFYIVFFLLRCKNGCLGAVLQMAVMPIVILFLFSLCISIRVSFKGQSDFRKITELFYFIHLIMPVELYDLIFSKLGKTDLAYNCGFIMIFYIVLSVVLSVLILKLSKTKVFKFLKYLY